MSTGSNYVPPLADIDAAFDLVDLDGILELPAFRHTDRDSVRAVLQEFGQIAAQVIGPIDAVGDRVGSSVDHATSEVVTPPGLAEAYRVWVAGGWGAVAVPAGFGGAGWPQTVAIGELTASASLAFYFNPMLTHSGVALLSRWGDRGQRASAFCQGS